MRSARFRVSGEVFGGLDADAYALDRVTVHAIDPKTRQVYLTPAQAANVLDVSLDTMRRYVRKGIVPSRRTPTGRYLVPETLIRTMLNIRKGHANGSL